MKSKLGIVSALLLMLGVIAAVFFFLREKKENLEEVFYLDNIDKMMRSIELKMHHDLSMAQLLAISLSNNPLVLQTLKEGSPDAVEIKLDTLSRQINRYSQTGKVWIQVISRDLYSLYRSWDIKRGDQLWFRKDLQYLAKHPDIHQGISVGKYNISYKNIIPVYESETLLGFVEAITFLPSTMERLMSEEEISSIVLIDQRYAKQLTANVNERFMGGHIVAFSNDDRLLGQMDENTVETLLRVPYHVADGRLMSIRQLNDLNEKQMGYIVMILPKNVLEGKLQETLRQMNLLLGVSMLVFVVMLGFALFYFRAVSKEMELVRMLNSDLQQTIDDNTQKIREQEFVIHEQSKNRAMTELLINLAHHWRQPLGAALLHIQRVEDIFEFEQGDRKKIDETLDEAVYEIETLSDSITDLTQVFEQGDERHTTLTEVMEVVRAFIADTLHVHSISVEVEIKQAAVLKASRAEMLEVLSALFLNVRDIIVSRKYPKAEILVRQKVLGEMACIEVIDDAGGIDPEFLPDRIFEPFSTTQFKGRNKGAGLYRVKQLVVEHLQGDVIAENFEAGAKFTIRIPHE